MTNLEARPSEHACSATQASGPELKVIHPRTVPLGGVRAMPVQRTLPHRELSLIGAWCFLDQFTSEAGAGMRVLPHPHTGLQTVTWPVTGEIRHRDSLGNDIVVRPGELNLMTAGRGVSHSEFSRGAELLSGVQLWLALPPGPDTGASAFEQLTELPVLSGPGWEFTVFIGELDGACSPAKVHTPLVGADGEIASGTEVSLALNSDWEHGIAVFDGEVHLHEEVDEVFPDRAVAQAPPAPEGSGADSPATDGVLSGGHLAYVGRGREELVFTAGPRGARVILIGGEPFRHPVVMFWNFIGRSHDDVAGAAEAWEQDWRGGGNARFGTVAGHGTDHFPGPALPPVRLRPRRSPHVPE